MARVGTAGNREVSTLAWDEAFRSAARSEVKIVEVETSEELGGVSEVIGSVWQTDPEALLPLGVLRALSHAGNYVVGAVSDGQLVGAGVGFFGEMPHGRYLHSHIVGVIPSAQRRSVGYAIKAHQRAWSLDRDITEIQWTFDPLVRRNGWFNLVKVGATIAEYHCDFYGPMDDGINGAEPSDRALAIWDLTRPTVGEAAQALVATATVVLDDDRAGYPCARPTNRKLRLCRIPADIVALRASDPCRAREWRLALRTAFLEAGDAGLKVVGMGGGGYLFAPRADA